MRMLAKRQKSGSTQRCGNQLFFALLRRRLVNEFSGAEACVVEVVAFRNKFLPVASSPAYSVDHSSKETG